MNETRCPIHKCHVHECFPLHYPQAFKDPAEYRKAKALLEKKEKDEAAE